MTQNNCLPELHYGWDLARDIDFASQHSNFLDVIHVFCAEWQGIRSAVGGLPGQKLALSEALPVSVVNEIGQQIAARNPSRIIFHGFSTFMERLVYHLADWGHSSQICIAMHATPAQWHDSFDRHQALISLRLASEGRIRKIHILKRGFDFPSNRLFRPMLFNSGPIGIQTKDTPVQKPTWAAFIPGRPQWTKNVFTQLLAAAQNERISRVSMYTDETADFPESMQKKIWKLSFTVDRVYQNYLDSDVTLNVSTTDCHPMINIESQSVGTPCIRGPLFLDALEHHPYVNLTTVRDVSSVVEIRGAIDRLRAVAAKELYDMTLDYQRQTNDVSIQRYLEFLEI